MVGSAIVRTLKHQGFKNLLNPSRQQLDLTDFAAVDTFFYEYRPEYVFNAAARVGGILWNSMEKADFLTVNIKMQNNIAESCLKYDVKKYLFLGSSCIYPREAKIPITEDQLLTGLLEPTNFGYALAKIVGIKLNQAMREQYNVNYISAMPCNLYGPGDTFHPVQSHFVPGLMRRFHEARVNGDTVVTVWGSGKPCRELMYSNDVGDACVFLMKNYDEYEHVNVGSGDDYSVSEVAEMIKKIVKFNGTIEFDLSKPDGVIRKVMDVSKMTRYGWKPKVGLQSGLEMLYENYLAGNYKLERNV